MKRLFYAAGLFTVLASANSFGQTQTLGAQIPFTFHMGPSVMPAGEYLVRESGDLLVIREASGKATAAVLTLPASRKHTGANPTLQFQRYGNDYFLDKIWTANSEEGRALGKSKREKELLAGRATPRSTDEVVLQTKNHPPAAPK